MKKNETCLDFSKGDIGVIGFVIILAFLIGIIFGRKVDAQKGNIVVIYKEGEKIQELPLDKNNEIIINNDYTNRVVIEDGRASITESNCPGEDCVHSGWITGGGRSIVCLPNRVEIRIEGGAEVDFVVH